MIDYSRIPTHMREGTQRYIENGIPPGDFLRALVENDLFGAMGKADDVNQRAMFYWCVFFYNEAPSGCFGSPQKVAAWIASGGLNG